MAILNNATVLPFVCMMSVLAAALVIKKLDGKVTVETLVAFYMGGGLVSILTPFAVLSLYYLALYLGPQGSSAAIPL
jgi:hypothetical protein